MKRVLAIGAVLAAAWPAAAHTFSMQRQIFVQTEPSGAALLLVAVQVPRSKRAEILRQSWDRDGDGVLGGAEATAAAREVAETALQDVVVSADGEEAACTVDAKERALAGAITDAAFEIAILVECPPAREWIVYAGRRMPTELRVLRHDAACLAPPVDSLLTWVHCP
jgi:hypothetical protein